MNYKHKQTGAIASDGWSSPNLRYYNVVYQDGKRDRIHPSFIENTTDWEPIEDKKPLFVTEDGVEVFDDTIILPAIDTLDNFRLMEMIVRVYLPASDRDRYKVFSTKEAAQAYVDKHAKKYSRKEMEEFSELVFKEMIVKLGIVPPAKPVLNDTIKTFKYPYP